MNLKSVSIVVQIVLLLFLPGCYEPTDHYVRGRVEGYVPVYGAASQKQIAMLQPRAVDNPGKIYRYGDYLLVNEKKKGIHVFDNSDPAEPRAIGFIEILGNTDMAIRNDVLYADHLGQLVALAVTDFTSLEEKGRLPLSNWNNGVPAPSGHHFECIDPSRGLVVSWKKAVLLNPQCYAY